MIEWPYLFAPLVAGAIIGAAAVQRAWVRWADRYMDRRLNIRFGRRERRSAIRAAAMPQGASGDR